MGIVTYSFIVVVNTFEGMRFQWEYCGEVLHQRDYASECPKNSKTSLEYSITSHTSQYFFEPHPALDRLYTTDSTNSSVFNLVMTLSIITGVTPVFFAENLTVNICIFSTSTSYINLSEAREKLFGVCSNIFQFFFGVGREGIFSIRTSSFIPPRYKRGIAVLTQWRWI